MLAICNEYCQRNSDKAKKEFVINTGAELRSLRTKYQIKKDEKAVKPWFFAHIVKRKGYYDPVHKAYIKFKTSMDYLQEAINSYTYRVNRYESTEYLPFYMLVNNSRCRCDAVDHALIDQIFTKTRELKNRTNYIYKMDSSEMKYQLICDAKLQYNNYIASLKMNRSTTSALLQSIESEYVKSYAKTLFYSLFSNANESLFQFVMEDTTQERLIPKSDGDVMVYGYRFEIVN